MIFVDGLAALLYVIAAAIYVRAWRRHEEVALAARQWVAAGVIVQLAGWVVRIVTESPPGFASSLSGAAMGLMSVWALVAQPRVAALGAFLVPAATGVLVSSLLLPDPKVAALEQAQGSWWLPLHLGLVFVAIAGFSLEFVVGGAQALVQRRLKRKQLAGLSRFPSLDALDEVRSRALAFALVTLGLGVVVGLLGAWLVMHHQAWAGDPKVWATALVWLWYAGVFAVRQQRGWHGRWSVWLSTAGFAGLVFSFVGLEFLIGGFHAYSP